MGTRRLVGVDQLLLGLGRLEGVSRPALAAFFPNAGHGTVVLDVGANAEVKPAWLVQFAHMGSCMARYLLGKRHAHEMDRALAQGCQVSGRLAVHCR